MELLAIYGPASGYSCYSHQDIAVAVPEESGVTLYGLESPLPQHLHIQSRPPLMEKFGGVSPNLAFRRREENSSSSASNQGVIVIWGVAPDGEEDVWAGSLPHLQLSTTKIDAGRDTQGTIMAGEAKIAAVVYL